MSNQTLFFYLSSFVFVAAVDLVNAIYFVIVVVVVVVVIVGVVVCIALT